jgi:type III restriction enzyme
MNFTEKEYQQRALDRFDAYVTALIAARISYDKVAELKRANPELPIPRTDFAQTAWETLRAAGQTGRNKPYSPRITGDGYPVPNATFKLPTGGGKTYLATAAVARLVTHYLRPGEPRFILWVVPSEAIYAQTKRQLTDREHPYRQLLDRVSGGRVRILEKTSPLTFADVEAGLNVMLLMLPSANRETKDSLRIFRDRGDVFGFLPPDDDLPAHGELVRRTPNLDYIVEGAFGGPAVGSIDRKSGV